MPSPKPSIELSVDEARLIALRAQGFLRPVKSDDASLSPSDSVFQMLDRVSAVQLDTISVLARSHELVAYARLGPVGRKTIENAYWGQPPRTFEYIGHAGCIFPLEMWPYFAFRRRAQSRRFAVRVEDTTKASSERWRTAASAFDELRARLRDGPVVVGDLGGARKGTGWWNWSAAKSSIESLYRLGEVVCTTRRGWQRVYDFPERAVPPELLKNDPSDEDCYVYLVRRAAQALGVGTKRDIAAYFGLTTAWLGSPSTGRRLLDIAIEVNDLLPVAVEGWSEIAFVSPEALASPSVEVHRTTLVSPFDTLIWRWPVPPEGERTKRLFGFSVPFEPYVPKERRVHGYFTMPLLADGRLLGLVDPARLGRTLVGRKVTLQDESAIEPMAAALREAAAWVGCGAVGVEQVEPSQLAEPLSRLLSQ